MNPFNAIAIILSLVLTGLSIIIAIFNLRDRLTRNQDRNPNSESGNFKLLNLKRLVPTVKIPIAIKVTYTIIFGSLILFGLYFIVVLALYPPYKTVTISQGFTLIGIEFFIIIFMLYLPVYLLYEEYYCIPVTHKTSVFHSVELEIDCDGDKLFRYSQKLLFDMKAIINYANNQSGEITAFLRNSVIIINVKRSTDQSFKVTISSDNRTRRIFLDRNENRRNVNELLYRLCYPLAH